MSLAAVLALSSPICAAEAAATPVGESGSGRYLILHAPHLAEAADEWATYRANQGWDVSDQEVAPGATAEEVRAAIRAFDADSRREPLHRGPLFILLLGDADERGIPTFHFDQPDSSLVSARDERYASDHAYQLRDDRDDLDDFALGRVPARTNEEARALLDKIRAYERAPSNAAARRHITYAAGEGRFGPADQLLERMFETMVRRFVPPEFECSVTYANARSMYCPPPSEFTATYLARLGEGALFYNYVGHGHATGFDSLHDGEARHRVLEARHLDGLESAGELRPIALLACCSTGWYDLPDGEPSMAEAMLLHRAGPIAVIAGSRLTHPYANIIIQKDVTELLLRERVRTLGELDVRAMRSMALIDAADRQIDFLAEPIARAGDWPSTLRELREMHMRLYNLLGDPALRIAHPLPSTMTLELKDGVLIGTSSHVSEGAVHIRIETDVAEVASPHDLLPIEGADAPALETRAQRNYALANDRTLVERTARMESGGFEIALPHPLPVRARWLRVEVRDDASGDADHGVLRVGVSNKSMK